MASLKEINDRAVLEKADDFEGQKKAKEFYEALDFINGPMTLEVPRDVHPHIEQVCDDNIWPCYHVSRMEGRNWYSFAVTYAELHEYEVDR